MSLQTPLIHPFNVGNCEFIDYMPLSGNLPDFGSRTSGVEKLSCRAPAPPVVPGQIQISHPYIYDALSLKFGSVLLDVCVTHIACRYK